MKLVIKSLLGLLFLFSVLVLIALAVLRFYPRVAVLAVNQFSDYRVSAKNMQLGFFPLSLELQGLSLSQQGKQAVQLQQARIKVDWFGWYKGRYNFWYASVSNGVINLPVLAKQGDDTQPLSKSWSLHPLLSFLNGEVNQVTLIIDNQTKVLIDNIATHLNNKQLKNSDQIEQTIELQVQLLDAQQQLDLSASLRSRVVAGRTKIEITIPRLDLSALATTYSTPDFTSTPKAAKTEQAIAAKEAVINWAWLDDIEKTDCRFSVKKLTLLESNFNDLVFDFSFDESIKINDLSSFVDINHQGYRYQDTLKISGQLRPLAKRTKSADIAADLIVISDKGELSLKGELNLNGLSGQAIESRLLLQKPLSKFAEDAGWLTQYFPLSVQTNISTNQQQQLIVESLQVRLADSDLSLSAKLDLANVLNVEFEAKSDVMVYKDLSEEKLDAEQTANADSDKPSDLFTDDALNWSWLERLNLQGRYQAKQLILDQYKIENLDMPITLQQAKLTIPSFQASMAGGQIDSFLSLQQSKTEQASIDMQFDLRVSDLPLAAFKLIPEEQVDGGTTQASIQLSSSGVSPKALATNAKGQVLMQISQAVINNNSFEIIGSDLLFELLNKLNPFSKTDESTNLKCAVVNTRINDGKARFKNSLAIETDKVAIIANGNINLANEKISLNIKPRTQKGLGVNVGSLVKLMHLGGTLSNPKLTVSAGGLLKTGVAVGVAATTGGLPFIAEGLLGNLLLGGRCDYAKKAFE